MTFPARLAAILLSAVLSPTPDSEPHWAEGSGVGAVISSPPFSSSPAPNVEPSRPDAPAEEASNLNICGPLALASVSSYLGRPELYDRIFSRLPPTGEPHTLNELAAVASQVGLATRAVRWRPGRPLEFSCPAIVRLDPLSTAGIGHFVVVLRTAGDSVQILDMPNPPSWETDKKLWDLWDGIALHVAASESDLPRENDLGTVPWLPSLAFVAGLSTLLLLAIPRGRGRTPTTPSDAAAVKGTGGRTRRLLVLSAIMPAALLAPSLIRWGSDHASPIDRTLIEGAPSFKNVEIDARSLKAEGKKRAAVQFSIHNRTGRPAIIAKVSTSCACASPRPSTREIPAGGSAELVVDVEPQEGKVRNFTIDVLFKQPENYHVEMSGSISVLSTDG